ncbi:methyl-accepting chemotaxis protein, partial [Ralstonia pseudosolanacearum]
ATALARRPAPKAAVARPPATAGEATPSATASSNEQQRTRQAAAKAVVPAPKKQAPKLVAAGGDESDWETF